MNRPSARRGGAKVCIVCKQRPRRTGVLCASCSHQICAVGHVAPEQLEAHTEARARAAVIDCWGRILRLDPTTQVGRVATGSTLLVVTPSVSKQHAVLYKTNGGWIVQDVGSASGTFVDDRRITDRTAVEHGAVLRFGDVPLFFILDATAERSRAARTRYATPVGVATIGRDEVVFEFIQPTGGGAALVIVDGKQFLLTIAQSEFLRLLATRMDVEKHIAAEDRGYVTVEDLITKLPLETVKVNSDNIRQIVRRVRHHLASAGVEDLIESSRGRGYRLRKVPRII